VHAAHVVHVGRQRHALQTRVLPLLRTARIEGIEDHDGRRLDLRTEVEIHLLIAETGVHERAAAQRPGFLDADVVVQLPATPGAIRQVVVADAEVLQFLPVEGVRRAKRLILRHRVIEDPVHIDELAWRAQPERLRRRPVHAGDVDDRRGVLVLTVHVERKARPALDQRAAHVAHRTRAIARPVCWSRTDSSPPSSRRRS
jgi:hypothetical protein